MGNQLDGYIKVEVKDYHTITGYYIQDVLESYKWGLVGGFPDGTFRPKSNATRAQACVVLNKMQEKETRSPFTPDNAAHVIMPIGVWYDRDGNIVDIKCRFKISHLSERICSYVCTDLQQTTRK